MRETAGRLRPIFERLLEQRSPQNSQSSQNTQR
jgi:hypothetical protein